MSYTEFAGEDGGALGTAVGDTVSAGAVHATACHWANGRGALGTLVHAQCARSRRTVAALGLVLSRRQPDRFEHTQHWAAADRGGAHQFVAIIAAVTGPTWRHRAPPIPTGRSRSEDHRPPQRPMSARTSSEGSSRCATPTSRASFMLRSRASEGSTTAWVELQSDADSRLWRRGARRLLSLSGFVSSGR